MAKNKKHKTQEPTIENRKARFDYHITDTLETGIKLVGSEVKSVRDGKVSIGEGYVRAQESPPELVLHSVNIAEYAPAGALNHKPVRPRILLAKKKEIVKLAKEQAKKGVTLVPLKMYFKNGYVKVQVGVGVGKSQQDKRESIAKREIDRDIQRAVSRRM